MHRLLRLLVLLLATSPPAVAQPTPVTQPMRIIVPFAPGGAPDIVARLLAQHAAGPLGQPVAVENRTGAGGNIGMQAGARAAPDGNTLLMCTLGCASNAFLMDNLGWDPATDIRPVMMAGVVPNVLIVGPQLPARSVREFLDLARARDGALTMASSGVGSASHLAGEMFKAMANVRIEHVPYRGSTVALPDIIAGRVDSMIVSLPEALEHILAGRVVALGVSSAARAVSLPEVPTIAEAGVPGYAADFALVLFAPRATPEAIVTRFRQAFVEALKSPDVVDRLKASDQTVVGSTSADAARILAADARKWGEVARRIRLGLD